MSPARATAPPARDRMARRRNARRIAAIDIGSNSIRQIVADVSSDGAITVVDEMKAQPRLGTEVDATGVLGDQAIERAVETIARMTTLARKLGAERVEAVATSAVRDATNAARFLARVKQETGVQVRVLDGIDEARLSFRSALAHFDLGAGRWVVMDIGGGSLELALSADGVVDNLCSLPFGALRLTERYLANGVTTKAVRRLRRDVRDELREVLPAREWRGAHVIGSGGTFTNLAGMTLARQRMLAARTVHATEVARTDVEHLLDALGAMTADERRQMPGLNPARADIIVAGVAVAAEVLARVGAREVHVSRYGIREGLLLETARVRAVAADPGAARERSVSELAVKCHYEMPHSTHVQKLALRLFDSIGGRLEAVPADRQLLADAALLHDVGYHISYDRHHKHSYHLILHAELLGVTPSEQVVMANVARYHRGASPKRKHRNFSELAPDLRGQVQRLSALLRVADGFDRGHVGAVSDLKVRWLTRAVRITPVPDPRARGMRLEAWGAHRKSQFLAELCGRPVEIVMPDGEVLSSDDVTDEES